MGYANLNLDVNDGFVLFLLLKHAKYNIDCSELHLPFKNLEHSCIVLFVT